MAFSAQSQGPSVHSPASPERATTPGRTLGALITLRPLSMPLRSHPPFLHPACSLLGHVGGWSTPQPRSMPKRAHACSIPRSLSVFCTLLPFVPCFAPKHPSFAVLGRTELFLTPTARSPLFVILHTLWWLSLRRRRGRRGVWPWCYSSPCELVSHAASTPAIEPFRRHAAIGRLTFFVFVHIGHCRFSSLVLPCAVI